jgi:Crinkler effector protein N-terminal domain
MSITLFCLVKGNTTANAFEVNIEKDKSVSHLKKVIKAEKAPEFDNFPADRLKLWKVPISDDHDDQLRNLSLENSDELLAIRKISKYFPDSPPEEHIHVLVSPPETTTSGREQELLDQVASLQALLKKSVYGM